MAECSPDQDASSNDPPSSPGNIDLGEMKAEEVFASEFADRGGIDNLAFSADDEKVTLSTLQAEANLTQNSLSDSLDEWTKYLWYIQKNKDSVRKEIEERRDALISLINDHAQTLIAQADDLIGSYEGQAQGMKDTLSGTVQEVDAFIESEVKGLVANNEDFKDDKEKKDALMKHCGFLVKELQSIRKKTSGTTPLWLPLKLYSKSATEYLVSHLYGTVRLTDQKDYPLKYCEPLSMLKRICCQTKQDQEPNGLVDMAVAANGHVLVADKQNKLLKMFNRNGSLEKVIRSGNLKDPNRLTVLPHNEGILVNDNFIRFIKLYNTDGNFVRDFVNNIKCPTGLCVNHKGDVLVTEYETKTIMVVQKDGQCVFSFKSQLTAPAHISAGPRGHIVVTDWRYHTMKVFQVTGECIWSIKGKGDGNNQLDQPQGTCFDPFGNILVADTNNHRIQCFTDEGAFLKTVISKSVGLRLPMAVHCDPNGYLYVAEYQGFVKIFKYLQHIDQTLDHSPDTPEFNNNLTSKSSSKNRLPVEDETSL